jgi:hypothetical protein
MITMILTHLPMALRNYAKASLYVMIVTNIATGCCVVSAESPWGHHRDSKVYSPFACILQEA